MQFDIDNHGHAHMANLLDDNNYHSFQPSFLPDGSPEFADQTGGAGSGATINALLAQNDRPSNINKRFSGSPRSHRTKGIKPRGELVKKITGETATSLLGSFGVPEGRVKQLNVSGIDVYRDGCTTYFANSANDSVLFVKEGYDYRGLERIMPSMTVEVPYNTLGANFLHTIYTGGRVEFASMDFDSFEVYGIDQTHILYQILEFNEKILKDRCPCEADKRDAKKEIALVRRILANFDGISLPEKYAQAGQKLEDLLNSSSPDNPTLSDDLWDMVEENSYYIVVGKTSVKGRPGQAGQSIPFLVYLDNIRGWLQERYTAPLVDDINIAVNRGSLNRFNELSMTYHVKDIDFEGMELSEGLIDSLSKLGLSVRMFCHDDEHITLDVAVQDIGRYKSSVGKHNFENALTLRDSNGNIQRYTLNFDLRPIEEPNTAIAGSAIDPQAVSAASPREGNHRRSGAWSIKAGVGIVDVPFSETIESATEYHIGLGYKRLWVEYFRGQTDSTVTQKTDYSPPANDNSGFTASIVENAIRYGDMVQEGMRLGLMLKDEGMELGLKAGVGRFDLSEKGTIQRSITHYLNGNWYDEVRETQHIPLTTLERSFFDAGLEIGLNLGNTSIGAEAIAKVGDFRPMFGGGIYARHRF